MKPFIGEIIIKGQSTRRVVVFDREDFTFFYYYVYPKSTGASKDIFTVDINQLKFVQFLR